MPGNRLSVDAILRSYAFEQITVSTVAIGFTASKLFDSVSQTNGIAATVVVENNPLRYRGDGTDPTAAIGMLVPTGTTFTVRGPDDLSRFKMIRQGASDALVSVTYYK